jgi:toxin ParE1/3/4
MAERKPAVLWSPEALADIDHLWEYYVQAAGQGSADRILREIAKAVAVIDATKSDPACAPWRLLPKLSSID